MLKVKLLDQQVYFSFMEMGNYDSPWGIRGKGQRKFLPRYREIVRGNGVLVGLRGSDGCDAGCSFNTGPCVGHEQQLEIDISRDETGRITDLNFKTYIENLRRIQKEQFMVIPRGSRRAELIEIFDPMHYNVSPMPNMIHVEGRCQSSMSAEGELIQAFFDEYRIKTDENGNPVEITYYNDDGQAGVLTLDELKERSKTVHINAHHMPIRARNVLSDTSETDKDVGNN